MMSYPAKSHYFGDVATQYDSRRTLSAKWTREQEINRDLTAGFDAGSTVLDGPVGSGRFIEYYEANRLSVVGIDISEDMLAEARKKCTGKSPVSFHAGNVENLLLGDDSVDYALCIRLLNWVPLSAMLKIVKEYKRVSRQGIVVGVRVAQKLSVAERFRAGIADALPTLGNLKTWLRVLRKKTRQTLSMLMGKTNPKDRLARSFFLHDEKKVLRLFESAGMRIEQKFLVERSVSSLVGVAKDYSFYYLRPTGP